MIVLASSTSPCTGYSLRHLFPRTIVPLPWNNDHYNLMEPVSVLNSWISFPPHTFLLIEETLINLGGWTWLTAWSLLIDLRMETSLWEMYSSISQINKTRTPHIILDFLKLDDKFSIIVNLYACRSEFMKSCKKRGSIHVIGQRLPILLLKVLTLRGDFTINCGT